MSANTFFLGGTELVDVTLARADERDAPSTYAALINEVRARCGADVASLFAEPIRGSNRANGQPNVAWYCAHDGAAFPLRQLDSAARGPIVELLRQRLRRFATLFSDSRHGAIYASWLNVLSVDSIVGVAGQPVIRDWGMIPNSIASSEEARDRHFREGIGQYLAAIPTPPFSSIQANAFATAMGRHAERETARNAVSAVAIPITAVAQSSGGGPGRPWLAPTIAASCAALVFVVLAFGHVLRYPFLQSGLSESAIQAQRQTNEALRERLASLRRAAADACHREEPLPGSPRGSLLPPSPDRTKIETTDPVTRRPETSTLGALLEKATVLVIMEHSLGSGFFVSDRYIVTNHHVVGNALEAKVASRALGGLVPAHVVAVGSGAERGTQDIAVLQIDAKPGTSSLSIGVAPPRLEAVTAAGYPGAVLETIAGGRSELPEANFTQGIVTSHQVQQPGGIQTIIHTAQIGHGNSGGPLVDGGGCAVGINSWLSPDAMGEIVFSTYFQALDASELRRFLHAHDIAFTPVDAGCQPVAPPLQPTPQPAKAP